MKYRYRYYVIFQWDPFIYQWNLILIFYLLMMKSRTSCLSWPWYYDSSYWIDILYRRSISIFEKRLFPSLSHDRLIIFTTYSIRDLSSFVCSTVSRDTRSYEIFIILLKLDLYNFILIFHTLRRNDKLFCWKDASPSKITRCKHDEYMQLLKISSLSIWSMIYSWKFLRDFINVSFGLFQFFRVARSNLLFSGKKWNRYQSRLS